MGRQTFYEELGEGNETEDVRREHSVDVAVLYIANAVDAVRAASVIDCPDESKKTKSKSALPTDNKIFQKFHAS